MGGTLEEFRMAGESDGSSVNRAVTCEPMQNISKINLKTLKDLFSTKYLESITKFIY